MEVAGYALVGVGALLVLGVALLARRDTGFGAVRRPRADPAAGGLAAAAGALGGAFRPPGPASGPSGSIELRRAGCAVTVTVAGKGSSRRLQVRVLHYGADETTALDGPGLAPTDLHPDALLAAIDAACTRVVTRV